MKANAFLVLIWLTVGIVGYLRLPEMTVELRQGWQPWQIEMMVTSAAVVVGALAAVACLAVMVVYGRPRR